MLISGGVPSRISILLADGTAAKPGTLVATFNTTPMFSEAVARSLRQNCEPDN
jgi:hypothetical protein